jgi:hypothetical protein
MAHDQLLEAGSLGHAPAEEERAHPAVDEDGTRGETIPKAFPRQAAGRWLSHQPVGSATSGRRVMLAP